MAVPAGADKPRKGHKKRRSHYKNVIVELTSQPGLRVRNSKRAFGTRTAVDVIANSVQVVLKQHPKTVDLPVGDLSWRGGGRMRPHRSHRDGRDIDVGYYFNDGKQRRHFRKANRKSLDAARTWALFQAMLDTGTVEYIFVSYRLQKALYQQAARSGVDKKMLSRWFQWPRHWRNRRGVIRHERGHDDHFHVRFTQ